MEVFWAKGYEGTSMADLLEAMELSKSSLYETYGSKHELFLAALDRYRESRSAKALEVLEGTPSAREGIRAVFEGVIAQAADCGEQRGCFLNNCAVEVEPSDAAAVRRVRGGMAFMEAAFTRAVQRGQAAGEIPAGRDATALGRYLQSALMGLTVTAKSNPDRPILESVLNVIMQATE